MHKNLDSVAAVLIPSLCALAAAGCGAPSSERQGAAVAASAAALADTSSALGSSGCRVALPSPALAPPAGKKLDFGLSAVGVQIYTCTAAATGFAWVFTAPEADLFDRGGTKVGKHYGGPTWEATDGSKVVGARVAGATPDPASIPWLLLSAASHSGKGRMDEVSFIQRLGTSGGIPPTAGCGAASAGAVARVPYTASYCFFEAD